VPKGTATLRHLVQPKTMMQHKLRVACASAVALVTIGVIPLHLRTTDGPIPTLECVSEKNESRACTCVFFIFSHLFLML
jgi:hypothetical protein